MKTVLVFGTFDHLHKGHLYVFEQAKKYGDHLTAVIAQDSTVEHVKGNLPKYSQEERMQAVRECGLVDEVILGKKEDKYQIIKEINPQVICLGYDQRSFTDKLEQKLKELNIDCQIIRLDAFHPEKYKSSKLK